MKERRDEEKRFRKQVKLINVAIWLLWLLTGLLVALLLTGCAYVQPPRVGGSRTVIVPYPATDGPTEYYGIAPKQ